MRLLSRQRHRLCPGSLRRMDIARPHLHLSFPPSPLSVDTRIISDLYHDHRKSSSQGAETYQGLHRPVQRMSMVPSELGIRTLERGVSMCLWLLDSVCKAQVRSSDALLFGIGFLRGRP